MLIDASRNPSGSGTRGVLAGGLERPLEDAGRCGTTCGDDRRAEDGEANAPGDVRDLHRADAERDRDDDGRDEQDHEAATEPPFEAQAHRVDDVALVVFELEEDVVAHSVARSDPTESRRRAHGRWLALTRAAAL